MVNLVPRRRPRGDVADPVAAPAELPDEAEPVVLDLADLIADPNGEVVLFNDSGLRSLTVSTDAAVVAEGASGRHVTAAGVDVSGHRYLAFDNGLKLYYQPDLDLILVRGAG